MKLTLMVAIPLGSKEQDILFRGKTKDSDGGRFYVTHSEVVSLNEMSGDSAEGFSVAFSSSRSEGKKAKSMSKYLSFFNRDAKILPSQLRELADWIEGNLGDAD